MAQFQNAIEIDNEKGQERRLLYLSETLADSLQDMDKTQQSLKEFALKNSTMAQENFISEA